MKWNMLEEVGRKWQKNKARQRGIEGWIHGAQLVDVHLALIRSHPMP